MKSVQTLLLFVLACLAIVGVGMFALMSVQGATQLYHLVQLKENCRETDRALIKSGGKLICAAPER